LSGLTGALQNAAETLGGGGLIYMATVGAATATSLFASSPERRRDARATLALLVRRPGRSNQDVGDGFGQRSSEDTDNMPDRASGSRHEANVQ
jgi:hypothetical protein